MMKIDIMSPSTRQNLVFILILVTVNLALFLPSMSGDFLWDDVLLITENPALHDPQFLSKFLTSPFGGSLGKDENSRRLERVSQFYRPLTSLSYWLDFSVWGKNPAAFHLTNICLHILNVSLLFYFLSLLGVGPFPSFFGALLFSFFPLHFENVAWISGRTDLLSFLFIAFSCLLLLRYLKTDRSHSLRLSGLFYFFSLLSKETALFLPAVFLMIFFSRNRRLKILVCEMSPFLIAFAAWFGLRSLSLSSSGFLLSGRPFGDLFASIGYYVYRLVFPFNLPFTIDADRIFGRTEFLLLGGLAVVSGVVMLAAFRRNQKKWLTPALLLTGFLLSLLPSVLVIFSEATVSFLAWRFLYLPSVFFIGGMASLFRQGGKRPAVSILVLIGLLALYGMELYPKNRAFGSSEKEFWTGIKKYDRENILARFNIAQFSLSENEEKSLEIFNSILSRSDHFLYTRFKTRIHEELAAFYTFNGRPDEAKRYFDELLRTGPNMSQHFYVTYASYLALTDRPEEGRNIIDRLLSLFPENHLILLHAAKFYIILQDYDRALELLTRDFALFPTEEIKGLLEQVRRVKDKHPGPVI